MILLKILLAHMLMYYLPQLSRYRSTTWLKSVGLMLEENLANQHPITRGLAFLLPINLIAILLQYFCLTKGHGIIDIVLSVSILWYCLASPAFEDSPWLDWFWQAHERDYAVLFWFMLLGIPGAVLYRTVGWLERLYPEGEEWQWVKACHGVLAWVPARLTAFLFVLVGDFNPGFQVFKHEALNKGKSKELLVATGLASLNLTEDNNAESRVGDVSALLKRTLMAWVVLIALLTIGYILL